MRVFTIDGNQIAESDQLPQALPPAGLVWIACARREFEVLAQTIQASLPALGAVALIDLHLNDLLNNQLPSHYDYTSQYDIMVFRRLATGQTETDLNAPGAILHEPLRRSGPVVLRHIDTSPVGFAVFDRVLLTVHPTGCAIREGFAAKLLDMGSPAARASGVRPPTHPADLMLRIINLMVDGYLDLRRELTRQLDHWQSDLLNPKARFNNWGALLDARLALHQLDEICEDQRAAVQDWIEALAIWPEPADMTELRERELLKVRSRDVLEHIERVIHHVRRLEHSAETAVQMHFSAQSNRANDIMRTLTALTAIFLPLNLIAGIFGMNFEFLPLIHQKGGFWISMLLMGATAAGLGVFFWRNRYLSQSGK